MPPLLPLAPRRVVGHGHLHRAGQRERTDAFELFIHQLQAANQVEHFAARVGATGGFAKVRATSKGAAAVDDTFAARIEHGTGSGDGGRGQLCAPSSAEAEGGDHGFTFREHGRLSGEFKLATLRPPHTSTLHGARGEIGIDGADFLQRLGFELARRFHGKVMRHNA